MKRSVDLGGVDPRPYVRLAARLRKEILNGALAPGSAMHVKGHALQISPRA